MEKLNKAVFRISFLSFFIFAFVSIVQSKKCTAETKTLSDTASSSIKGAYGDGIHDDTKAIQAALDSVSAKGGGIILFAHGKYLTGPLTIKANDTLEVDGSGAIIGTANMKSYYPPGTDTSADIGSVKSFLPLFSADHADNIAIIGKGYIDGQGQEWWAAKENGILSKRPKMFEPHYCNNILLKNITLKNSPMYFFIPMWCDTVIVDSVSILAPPDSYNTDGIDPATCHYVLITNCYIDNGDDNIAVKARDRHEVCSRIYVSHCTFMHGHGVSIGSDTRGGVDSMYVDSCTFNGTAHGIRIKSSSRKRLSGGNVRNIYYSNLTMKNVKFPIYFCEYYPKVPPESDPPQPVTSGTPYFHDITVTNLKAVDCPNAGLIIGVPEMPMKNIKLINVSISAGKNLKLRNATVDTSNTRISPGIDYQVGGIITGIKKNGGLNR